MDSQIEIDAVQVRRQGTVVLQDITLRLRGGCMTGLVGANGAGKSTLLACISGDIEASDGSVRMDDHDVFGLTERQQARWRSVMTQHTDPGFNLSVREVIEIGLHVFDDIGGAEREQMIVQAAGLADVSLWLARDVTTLSAGQLQRVHLARALVQVLAIRRVRGECWLFLDEPVSSQDPWQQQRILHVCRQLCADASVGVVVVLHDLSQVRRWCDDVVALADGKVVVHGEVEAVLDQASIARTFGSQVNAHFYDEPVSGVVLWSEFGSASSWVPMN